jgi:alkylation response protein AidB-like acyl-CoA dehydrogenase
MLHILTKCDSACVLLRDGAYGQPTMSLHSNSTPTDPSLEFSHPFVELDRTIAVVSANLVETAAERERERVLLHAPVRALIDAGFGAIRVPARFGGLGGSLEDLFERITYLASVDPNLAHVFRGHIGFIEWLHVQPDTDYAEKWFHRASGAILVGNAQSERTPTAELGSTIERTSHGLRLTGTKYYTTGSIYADWIQLSALLDGEAVSLVVDASHTGVRSIDDWDGFGQPLTGSGTTTFVEVPVDESDIVNYGDEAEQGEYVAAVFQLTLLAVIAGIGRAALRDTVEFVRPRRRLFGFAGEVRPRDNEVVQLTVGKISSMTDAAGRIVHSAARDLDSAREHATPLTRVDSFRQALLAVYRIQQIVPRLVLDAATELFEVGGASAVSNSIALDRHWRNARTLFAHNPAAQRERAIGEWELNRTFVAWGKTQAEPADSEVVAG